MQVFKAYFKVIKKHRVSLLIYVIIFVAISLLITSQLYGNTPAQGFSAAKAYVAFYSDDTQSPLVDGIKGFLEKNAQIVNIPDDTEKIQDALFYEKVNYVVRVPAGFTLSFLNSETAELKTMSAPGTTSGIYMSYLLNKYLNLASFYQKNSPGLSEAEIVQSVGAAFENQTQVNLNTYSKPQVSGSMSYYFQYFGYCILALMMMGVTSVMMAFNEKDLSNRIQCSPLKPLSMNLQMLLGNSVFAIGVWAFLCALIFGLYNGTLDTGSLLLAVNALVFTIASLSIGFLCGKFIRSHQMQAAVVNTISLGICFLSGVFVEQELLGKTVLAISSFTPGYWYVKAIDEIRGLTEYTASSVAPVINSMLIQLGFAAAILIIALAVSKQRRRAAV
jgi:ABC-2 type transport system permease protein